MKLQRKNFIKQLFRISAGYFLIPPIFLKSGGSGAAEYRSKAVLKPRPFEWKSGDINIAWIGHSTVLINYYGTVILTDPVLFDRIGIYFWGITFGPGRYSPPALTVEEIPAPDIILLSHAHLDHMDYETLSEITAKYPHRINCITAYNTKDVIEDLKWNSIKEIDWGGELSVCDINIKALEVKHFGWRYPWEKDRSRGFIEDGRSYNAYVMEKNKKKILFGGDTAYTENFLNSLCKPVDIAIMPVGAYNPWRRNHCNPEEALIMAGEHMNAGYFVPIHCNTFRQGVEPPDEPIKWLKEISPNYSVRIALNEIGETFNYPREN